MPSGTSDFTVRLIDEEVAFELSKFVLAKGSLVLSMRFFVKYSPPNVQWTFLLDDPQCISMPASSDKLSIWKDLVFISKLISWPFWINGAIYTLCKWIIATHLLSGLGTILLASFEVKWLFSSFPDKSTLFNFLVKFPKKAPPVWKNTLLLSSENWGNSPDS